MDRNDVVSTTIVTARGGLRFDAEIRGHIIPTDQPVAAGGDDLAAMPLELLSASLGTCVALYAHRFLTSRGVSAAALRVEVRAHKTHGSPRMIERFDVRVELPDGLPDRLLPLLERVVHSCPVHNTLAHAPEIAFELWAPEAVMT